MTNKIFIHLSLLLLLHLTTHCMEENHAQLIIPQQNTSIQELTKKRDEFQKKLDDNIYFWRFGLMSCHNGFFLSCTYRQHLHKKTYGQVSLSCDNFKELKVLDVNFFNDFNIDKLKDIDDERLKILQKARIDNYSALGSATMAEGVTLQEKQEFIQKLYNLGINEPTAEDKELALVEQWERWLPIIHKICLLRNALFFIDIKTQCPDVTKSIELLMLETEKSLL